MFSIGKYIYVSMVLQNTEVSLLLKHWSYYNIVLSYHYVCVDMGKYIDMYI